MDKKEVKKEREKLRREKIKKHETEATEIILEYSNDVAKMKLEKAGIFQELIALHKHFADGQIITEKAFERIMASFEAKLIEKNVADDVKRVITEVFQAVKKDTVRKGEQKNYPKAAPKPAHVQNPLPQFMPGRLDLAFPTVPLMVPNPFVVNMVQQMLTMQNDQIRQYQANKNVQVSAPTTPKLPPNPQQIPRQQQNRRKTISPKQILDESATSTSSSDTSSISLPSASVSLQETPKSTKRRSLDDEVLPMGNFLTDTPSPSISLPSISATTPRKIPKFVSVTSFISKK